MVPKLLLVLGLTRTFLGTRVLPWLLNSPHSCRRRIQDYKLHPKTLTLKAWTFSWIRSKGLGLKGLNKFISEVWWFFSGIFRRRRFITKTYNAELFWHWGIIGCCFPAAGINLKPKKLKNQIFNRTRNPGLDQKRSTLDRKCPPLTTSGPTWKCMKELIFIKYFLEPLTLLPAGSKIYINWREGGIECPPYYFVE